MGVVGALRATLAVPGRSGSSGGMSPVAGVQTAVVSDADPGGREILPFSVLKDSKEPGSARLSRVSLRPETLARCCCSFFLDF